MKSQLKNKILAIVLTSVGVTANAQNVQLHYDMGHVLNGNLTSRPSVTTTVEMFKPDAWGSTFMFTDINYQRDGVEGAYWEISREFHVSKNKQWAVHVEYNGGLSSNEKTWDATRFQHAVLAGGAWNWHSADFTKTFSLQAMYKYYFKIMGPVLSVVFSLQKYGAFIFLIDFVPSLVSMIFGMILM